MTQRWTRRMLLTEFGAAGVGLAVFAACSGSESSTGSDVTTAGSVAPSVDTAAVDDTDPAVATDPPDDRLRLQQVDLGQVSAYVLVRGRRAAVVDTGLSRSDDAILEGLGVLGATWSDVDHVVLTHRHRDHIGGLNSVLRHLTGVQVYAGEADLDRIRTTAPVRGVGDGDEVFGMGVLNTPGHTPGSISLFDTGTGILIAGDALNGDDGRLAGADPSQSSDMDLATASYAKMAALQPTTVAFGHGGAPISSGVADQLAALASG